MTNTHNGFELLGSAGDETRMLVHRESGYSIPIPGHPSIVDSHPSSLPVYAVVAGMRDLPMELGFRIDSLPAGTHPGALAAALSLAYAKSRAAQLPEIEALEGSELASGASAGSSCFYTVKAAPDPGARTMEQLEVTVREHANGLSALYYTVRYRVPGVNPVVWAHFRAALRGQQRWDGSVPAAPSLFPESAFAHPGVALAFTEPAWIEAQAKAAAIGQLADEDTGRLIKLLLEFSNTNAPPRMEMPANMRSAISTRLGSLADDETADAMLRNLDDVHSQHDLRAWIWQCVWAIWNRASRHN